MLITFNFYYFRYHYYNNNLEFHRLDGPSFENNFGSKYWCKNNLFHREDGPAIIYDHYNKRYYLHGKQYLEKEYWTIIKFKGYL